MLTGDHSPAETIAGNEDLLAELLTHLPVKSLLRFKSVCKQWLSLISGNRFSLLHSLRRRRRHRSSSALFFHHSLSSATLSPNFDFIPLSSTGGAAQPPPFLSLLNSSAMNILQSCNGLLLCSSSSQSNVLDFFVCNPSVDQVFRVSLPDHLYESGLQSLSGVNLAFDPLKSIDYKVICVSKSDSMENGYRIDLYSSIDRQWRRLIEFFMAPFDVEFERGVYCNGNLHWLSHTDSTLYLDVEREIIEPLTLPSAIEGAYIERFRYFGENRNHLHLIEIRTNCVSEFDILELDFSQKRWNVHQRVNLDIVGREFDEMFQNHSDRFGRHFRFYAFSILAVIRGDEEDESSLVLSIPGKVISYDFHSRVSRLLCDVADQSDRWLPFRGYNAYQFIESLYCA